MKKEIDLPIAPNDRDIIGNAIQPGDEWFIDGFCTYGWYLEIAKAYKPTRILETGVRYGYSAIALLAGARLGGVNFPAYVGIDGELDGLETNDIAGRNIRKSGPATGRIIKCDTRDEYETTCQIVFETSAETSSGQLTAPTFDLIHLDGDHRPDGVAAEIALAKRWATPGGIILIDDCDTEHVRLAAVNLSVEYQTRIEFFPTVHTLALVEVPCAKS